MKNTRRTFLSKMGITAAAIPFFNLVKLGECGQENVSLPTPECAPLPTPVVKDTKVYKVGNAAASKLENIRLITRCSTPNHFTEGHYVVKHSRSRSTGFGSSVDVILLASRPMAIDMSCNKEPAIISRDFHSEIFKDITKRSYERGSYCQFGVSFLVYERYTQKPYELFLGTPGRRRLIPDFSSYREQGIPVTLMSVKMENEHFSWYDMKLEECKTPFTNLPNPQILSQALTEFRS